MNPTTVRVEPNVCGAWEVSVPDQPSGVTCKTVDEARVVARRCAADRRPCELIIRDAYPALCIAS
jgi:hypothetical protein